MPNRLVLEPSPYLQQHKDNPVDWYPWGEEAFAKARAEDKPIFLSVGYSTCHWCHVMEHESFESQAIAGVLNERFVSIKVDREERPDVDRVYMAFVQATTGSGGWPMNVWLTPALEPFYGGTYYPPSSRWGRPGFIEVLDEIARVWSDERGKVLRSAASIVDRLRAMRTEVGDAAMATPELLAGVVGEFSQSFDARRGGFGTAPKFPRPSELLFLLREHARTGAPEPLVMTLATLRGMALGGMRDHLGGGFHRYSVDADWRVPHFEKMLYDQAQLVLAYVEASQVTGDLVYLDVALDTLEYVRQDLTHQDGGFFSAEDADSVPQEHAGETRPHKSEGAFYVWTDAEIGDLLGDEADVFRRRYGVERDGNAPADPQQEFVGKNLLYTAMSIEQIASDTGQTVDAVQQSLEQSRERLLEWRITRPRPERDDKVLTAWNGLMIAAFAKAGRVLRPRLTAEDDDSRYLREAQRAARFVQTSLWDEASGTLRRRFRNGESGVDGYAEDYAYLIFGLLELFQADGDPAWLEWSIVLQARLDELFWDEREGGWFSTTGRDDSVLLRLKEDHDGAEPSATAIALHNLLVLSHLADDGRAEAATSYATRIAQTMQWVSARAARYGRAIPMMLAAISTYHAGMTQLVIVGGADDTTTTALLRESVDVYRPSMVVVPVVAAHRAALTRLLPWTASLSAIEGRATAYLCRDFTCQLPATTPDALRDQLGARG